MKNLFLILVSLIFLSCNTNNRKNDKLEYSKANNTIDTTIKKQTKKTVKQDTVIEVSNNRINEYTQFLDFLKDKNVISIKSNISDIIKKTDYVINKDLSLIILKLKMDENSDIKCLDPICVLAVLIKDNKSINHIKIPVLYEEDFELLFIDEHSYYFFEYYSSPVGFSEYYIFDTGNNIIFKTERIEEGLKVNRNSFNFSNNTFKANSQDSKEIVKYFFPITML